MPSLSPPSLTFRRNAGGLLTSAASVDFRFSSTFHSRAADGPAILPQCQPADNITLFLATIAFEGQQLAHTFSQRATPRHYYAMPPCAYRAAARRLAQDKCNRAMKFDLISRVLASADYAQQAAKSRRRGAASSAAASAYQHGLMATSEHQSCADATHLEAVLGAFYFAPASPHMI